jgi:hypothetical protein
MVSSDSETSLHLLVHSRHACIGIVDGMHADQNHCLHHCALWSKPRIKYPEHRPSCLEGHKLVITLRLKYMHMYMCYYHVHVLPSCTCVTIMYMCYHHVHVLSSCTCVTIISHWCSAPYAGMYILNQVSSHEDAR